MAVSSLQSLPEHLPLPPPEHYCELAELYLQRGENLQAYDATLVGLQPFIVEDSDPVEYEPLVEGMDHTATLLRLRQQQGRALARSGATEESNRLMQGLYEEGHRDGETLGVLARTYKDLWELESTAGAESETARENLSRSHQIYAEAYDLARAAGKVGAAYYNGINAATTAFLLGEGPQALTLARETRALCEGELERLQREGGDPYWLYATLGEAALLIAILSPPEEQEAEWDGASQWYRKAAQTGRGRFGDLHATRRNARFILRRLPHLREDILQHFQVPKVAVFAGHKLDLPDRPTPRFPPERAEAVKATLRQFLQEQEVGIGFASAAVGSDLMFWEALRELNGEIHVVLPYEQDPFRADNVTPYVTGNPDGTAWEDRFEAIIGAAVEVLTASPQRSVVGSCSYDYANLVLHGLAAIRAGQLAVELVPVAVWDGHTRDGTSGVASMVEKWRALGYTVHVIDPARPEEVRAVPPEPVPDRTAAVAEEVEPEPFETHMMAILFADAVGYSRLKEEQIPPFVEHFLGAVGELARESPHRPLLKNTWGDGLYFVFSGVQDAGRFALELQDRVARTAWSAKQLPELSLRIALHAGPVYSCTDPVTGQPNFTGTHVSCTARIEPVTPRGKVYASQAFAALAAASRSRGFTCDYVGKTPLAKGYGTLPMYHVRRRG